MTPQRRHEATTSELAGRDDDGRPLFLARCSCGWYSHPVDGSAVIVSWEQHHRAIYGDPDPTPPEGVDVFR